MKLTQNRWTYASSSRSSLLANGKDLVEEKLLKDNPDLAQTISRNDYELFKAEMTPASIGSQLRQIIGEFD